jgi:hypothetical protein
MNKHPHLTIDITQDPNVMVCEVCKKRQVLPAGSMPFRILEANLHAFIKLHKKCAATKKKVKEIFKKHLENASVD